MSIEVKLPDLGEGIDSGDILEIYVSEGDSINKEQGLIELETDKATVTVPSPQAGRVTKILVKPGQSVKPGAVILQLEPTSSKSVPPPASKPTAVTKASATSGAASAPAKPSPSMANPVPPPKNPSPPTSPSPARHVESTAHEPSAESDHPIDSSGETVVAASPSIRRFAREVGVDLSSVEGTGEAGRITREDVLRAVRETSTRAASWRSTMSSGDPHSTLSGRDEAHPLPGTPGNDEYGPVRNDRLSKIRKTIATQMHKSWTTAPHVTNFDDADVTELEAIRVSNKDDYAARGIKLTSMPFLIKAAATALRNHPLLNARLDLENDAVIYHDYVNVGIAVDTPRGLVVPNIRNTHHLSIAEISKLLADTSTRVRNGDFTIADIRGGTFTISNLGAIGGTYSTPIINVPEVAILLVGRTRKLPVVMKDDSIKVREMMPLSLSYDHRLIDGGTAARFLNEVIDLLETPSRLLLAIG